MQHFTLDQRKNNQLVDEFNEIVFLYFQTNSIQPVNAKVLWSSFKTSLRSLSSRKVVFLNARYVFAKRPEDFPQEVRVFLDFLERIDHIDWNSLSKILEIIWRES